MIWMALNPSSARCGSFAIADAESALRREGADVQLVNHEIAKAWAFPFFVVPLV